MRKVADCHTSATLTGTAVTVLTVTDPDFCLAGTKLNNLMKKHGAEQLMPLEKADEIKGKTLCMQTLLCVWYQYYSSSTWLQLSVRNIIVCIETAKVVACTRERQPNCCTRHCGTCITAAACS
jgi:hypothetical protein